jgi:hypothetical protein
LAAGQAWPPTSAPSPLAVHRRGPARLRFCACSRTMREAAAPRGSGSVIPSGRASPRRWRRAWARASPPGSRWPFGARGTSSTERGSASATSWAARPRPTRSSRSAPTRRRSRPPLVAPGGRGRDHARRHGDGAGDGAGARRRAGAIVEDHRSRPLGAPIGLFDYASWVELPGDDGLRAMMLGAFASNEVSTGSIARVFGRASAQQNPSVLGTVGGVTARGGRIV